MSYYGYKCSEVPGLDEARHWVQKVQEDVQDVLTKLDNLLGAAPWPVQQSVMAALQGVPDAFQEAEQILSDAIHDDVMR